MRGKRGIGTLAALAFVAGACSPPGEVAVTTTAAPTTTTTSTTTTSSTTRAPTTTTSLPPGLEPQELQYALADRSLVRYDTTQSVEMSIEAGLLGIGDEAVTIVFDLEGLTRNLVLASRDGTTFELTQDFRADSGEIVVESDTTTATQTLSRSDLADFGEVGAFAGVDLRGAVSGASAGAPGVARPQDPGLFLATSLGPPFPDEPVDEGSEWSHSRVDSVLGEMVTTVRIVDEVDTASGRAFAVEFDYAGLDLPIEVGPEEAAEVGTLEGLLASGILFDEFTIEFKALEGTGSGVFDPERGLFTELDTETTIEVRMDFAAEGLAGDGGVSIVQRVSHVLDTVDEANSFDVRALVAFHVVDPFLMAEARVLLADGVGVFFADPEITAAIDAKVSEVPGVVGGWATGERFEFVGDDFEDVESIGVQVITNDGSFRGSPDLAEELASIWSGGRPTEVAVDGGTAYRFRLDGREWLVGSDAQYTYVIVGDRSLAEMAMGQYLSAPLPYLWQAGDCVSPTNGDLPAAPYGEYGLTHCADRHEYEVIYSESLAEPDADVPYPNDLDERRNTICAEPFIARAGALPLSSDLGLITYSPSEAEWDAGMRYLACVIFAVEDDGVVGTVTGWVESASSSIELGVGDCLVRGTPVPCEDEHQAEIVAVQEFDRAEGAPYPDVEALFEELESACAPALDSYPVVDGPGNVEAGAITDMAIGWDVGERTYYCVAVVIDGGVQRSLAGSLTTEWELVDVRFGT